MYIFDNCNIPEVWITCCMDLVVCTWMIWWLLQLIWLLMWELVVKLYQADGRTKSCLTIREMRWCQSLRRNGPCIDWHRCQMRLYRKGPDGSGTLEPSGDRSMVWSWPAISGWLVGKENRTLPWPWLARTGWMKSHHIFHVVTTWRLEG